MTLLRVIHVTRIFLLTCVVAIGVGVGGYQAIAGSDSAADSGDKQTSISS